MLFTIVALANIMDMQALYSFSLRTALIFVYTTIKNPAQTEVPMCLKS